MDTNGFYKAEESEVGYAPNFVAGPGFDLNKNLKDTYQYPVAGWYWFDAKEKAYVFFNLPMPPALEVLTNNMPIVAPG